MSTVDTARNCWPMLALLSADLISKTGNVLTFVAIPWFVLQTTGSPTKTGITAATGALPVIFTGIFGGALIDRLGYKRSSILADLASGLSVAAIPLLYHTVGLAFWQLLLLVFLGSLLDAPGHTARFSVLPDLARLAGMPLERANSLTQAMQRVALLLGPPLGGVLIVTLGASNVLWIDAATFAASAVIVALAVPTRVSTGVEHSARPRYIAEILEGFRFIRQDRLLLWMMVTMALGSLLSEPIYTVVFPVYASEAYGGAVDLGLMYSALAAGSLVGLVFYGVLGPHLSHRAIFINGFVVRGLSFWVLVLQPPLPVVLGAIVVNAVCLEPTNPLSASLLQARVPDGLRGRVFGTYSAIGMGTLPLGSAVAGVLVEEAGLVSAVIAIAVVTLAHAGSLMFIPTLRSMDTAAEVAPSADAPARDLV